VWKTSALVTIDGLKRGQPDYAKMTVGEANVTRQQLPRLQAMIADLGPLQSVTFKGVDPQGADIYPQGSDIYDVIFLYGATQWNIIVTADGLIAGGSFSFQPTP
jgi:exopolyphosphatase/pppGpp-phosphohydrolase